MIIWMDDALFSGENRYVDCIAILRNAANRRHTLMISDDPSLSPFSKNFVRPYFDSWLAKLPHFMQVEINFLLDKLKRGVSGDSTSFGLAKRLLITERDVDIKAKVNITKSCLVDFKSAIRAVSLPLHILVENQINDAAFLRRLMPPDRRARLAELEGSGLLRYVQGGGITEIKKLIQFHFDDDKALKAFGLSSEVWKLLHFIIYDRDIDKNDKNRPSKDSSDIKDLCNNEGMMHRNHQLERRAQENYIPLEFLKHIEKNGVFKTGQARADFSTQLSQYAQFPPTEKYIFDMRNLTNGNIGKDYLKKVFTDNTLEEVWQDEWFESDGSHEEMRKLAQSIVAAM